MKVEPLLAESWEIAPDKKSVKFNLKKNVVFHNGEKMTADDVIYSFTRAAGPDGGGVRIFSGVLDPSGFRKIDDYTVVITLKEPMANVFLMSLNHPWGGIMNKKAIDKYGKDFGSNPVGTGRFKLEYWQKSDRVALIKFDEYHDTPAKLQRLQFRPVVEGNSRTIELESGAIQVSLEIPLIDSGRLEDNPEIYTFNVPGPNIYFLCFDVTCPPWDNPKVREAMDYAVARAGIVRAVLKNRGEPARSPISSDIKYSLSKDPFPEYNVDKAKKLLAEAGFPNGLKAELWVGDRTDPTNTAVVVQENLRAIGMEMELKVFEWGTFMEMMKKKDHPPFISTWWQSAPANDPYFYLAGAFGSASIGQTNRAYWNDKLTDDLLAEGAAMDDGPEREKVFDQLQRHLNTERPWLSLVVPNHHAAAHVSLKGYTFVAGIMNYFGEAYFE